MRGFTLIELVVVLGILAVLAGIVLASISTAEQKQKLDAQHSLY